SSYANQEAIAFYKQAIEQLARAPASQTYSISMDELQERIGDLLQVIVENAEARQSYGAALELINKDAGTRAIRNHKARLHRKIAKSYEIQREFAEAFRSYA